MRQSPRLLLTVALDPQDVEAYDRARMLPNRCVAALCSALDAYLRRRASAPGELGLEEGG